MEGGVTVPIAHCNIPSREEKPPSNWSSSFNNDADDSSASAFLTRSPSSFAVDQNKPPEADLFTRSAVSIPITIATINTNIAIVLPILTIVALWTTHSKAATVLQCRTGRYCLDLEPGINPRDLGRARIF
ncbi:unnamed protein product [Ilex paraguariensis]|uniref:Uncharacterized protein n=1 Tax=Ilex paraguariensis TaxID=185542 RepID=A0ABC8UAK0_9AQUA